MIDERLTLLAEGRDRIAAWLAVNPAVPPITIEPHPPSEWRFPHTCAYYRNDVIHICVEKCSKLGKGGRAWSWPGYAVVRTPYGVLAHELGHHVDRINSYTPSAYGADYGSSLRAATREKPLSGYCPDDREWFAEMFRLFVTNPDLLQWIRPLIYGTLAHRFRAIEPQLTWDNALAAHSAPERIRAAAANRVRNVT
jgi:hypothetical protein